MAVAVAVVTVTHRTGDSIMAVGYQIGLHGKAVANDGFGHKAPPINLWRKVEHDDTPERVVTRVIGMLWMCHVAAFRGRTVPRWMLETTEQHYRELGSVMG
jgi:hypothetical protein